MLSKEDLQHLQVLAQEQGVEVIVRPYGHIQLKGRLLVNWYPTSKNRTAYVDGCTTSTKHVTAEQAVRMASTPPEIVPLGQRDSRRSGYRKIREKLLKKSQVCHWCDAPLTLDTSTLDHVIPLARGGLDHWTNWCLACEECNSSRGHNMPEILPPTDNERQWAKEAMNLKKSIDDMAIKVMSFDAKLAVVVGQHKKEIMHQKIVVLQRMLRLKARLKWLNEQLTEIRSLRYQAKFSEVAKRVLDEHTYERIQRLVEEAENVVSDNREEDPV